MIKVEQDDIRLKLVHPIYKTVEDKQIFIKELRVKRWFKKQDISSIQDLVTNKNTISKTRCLIFDKQTQQFYVVFHSVKQVREALNPIPTKNQIGFINGSKIQSRKSLIRKH